MWKIFATSTVLLVFVTGATYMKYQAAEITIANQQVELQGWKNSHEVQSKTIDTLTALAKINAQDIKDLSVSYNQSQRETENVRTQITNLRYMEAESALQKPYERGVASDNRKRAMLLRFSGQVSTD